MNVPLSALAVVAVLAACSVSPTTSAPTTDPTAVVDTPPGRDAEPFTLADTGILPQPGSNGANGSGCLPDSPDLPDGVWFGVVTEAHVNAVTFDLRCWFSGEAAVRAAAEDGVESPPPNDYHVRDGSSIVRNVLVAPDAVAHALDEQFELVAHPITQWPTGGQYVQCPGPHCLVWLYVNDGVVTEVVEQYTP